MTSDLRLGLVGCGRLAEKAYVAAIERAAGVALAAVADPVPERCDRVAPGIPAFRGAAELIAAGAADALILATPAAEHVADARRAAEAGLPSLVEKPPAPTLADALELACLEPEPRPSFNRRFVPELAALRGAVPAGEPVELELAFHSSTWSAYEAREGPLLNLGPHLVDLARWVAAAEVARVRADADERDARVELGLAGGRGRAVLECLTNRRPYRESVEVRASTGHRARYAAGGFRGALRASVGRASDVLVPSLACQLEAFARAARGEPEPTLARIGDGLAVMAVLDAARASAARGGVWTAVEPVARRAAGAPAAAE